MSPQVLSPRPEPPSPPPGSLPPASLPSTGVGASLQALSRKVHNPLWSAAALVVVIAGLHAASAFLLPVVVAAMLAIICSPLVGWLERRRIPNVLAVLLVVCGMMAVLAAIGAVVGGSIGSFRTAIPEYQARVRHMVGALLGWLAQHGLEVQTSRLLEVVEPESAAKKAMELAGDAMGALSSALSNTFLVVITMILILAEGKTVPGKLRALSGDPASNIDHFRRIAREVQSYLGIKTVLSLATGVVAALWCAILGVDFALLWGLLAFLLNYIPNIGAILAAVPPMLLALVLKGPGSALALGAGFMVIHMVVGNVLEPMWMGRKLGLSTTVVFLSLVLWGEIWGPVGMLLSVPLTMVVKIMLENSKEWAFVARLLDAGSEEAEESPPDESPPDTTCGATPAAGGEPAPDEAGREGKSSGEG